MTVKEKSSLRNESKDCIIPDGKIMRTTNITVAHRDVDDALSRMSGNTGNTGQAIQTRVMGR
jgi:hypothetical protein